MNLTLLATAIVATNNVVSAEMPTIVVEASRLGKYSLEIPARVETISREEIVRSGAANVAELLSRRGDVEVAHLGGFNPAMTQISMRGYGENGFGRTLIMADGEILNNPDMYAPNLARIPMGAVERVEILHGPQTVLYGGQASAGMINFITDTKNYEKRSEIELKGGSYGTFGGHLGTRGGFADDGLAYWASADWERSDGFRNNSAYENYAATAGLRKDFANGAYARFSCFYDNLDYELPGPLSAANLRRPKKSYYGDDAAKAVSFGLNLEALGVIDEENSLKLTFTASRRRSFYENGDYTDIYGYYNEYAREYLSHVYAYTARAQYLNEHEFGEHLNRFTLGTDLTWETARAHQHDDSPAWLMTTSDRLKKDRFTAGVFADDEFFLADEISLDLGARAERMWTKNRLDKSSDYMGWVSDSYDSFGSAQNLLAYQAGLNYRPEDWTKIFLRWSRFYRIPFVDETSWRNYAEDHLVDPEHGWSVDFGFDLNYENEYFAGASLYLSDTTKEIYYNPVLMSNENMAGRVRRLGFESHLGWEREYLAGVFLRYSAVRAKITEGDYEDNDMPGVADQNLSLDGRVWLWRDCFVFGGYRLIGTRYAISDWNNSDKLGMDSILRLGAQYAPSYRYLKGFTFTLTCENLCDRDYCDYVVRNGAGTASAYYPAAGRSFFASVRYEF